ncbi:mycothiol transferase [Williamsia sp. MIQD14]|uniref:mycothiol transferase n=1 Tax=Williamsia sp. MIQD14 TaxID=3425703 RepID=UPI003DA0C381
MADDATALHDVLVDAFTRVDDAVASLTDQADPAVLTHRIDADANSIAWLIWHSARVVDDHITGLSGRDQLWPQWRDRFDLPFDEWATGYGQSSDEVAAVPGDSEALAGYFHAVHEATLEYVRGVDADEIERVVDDNWDPPVTAGVRLVSVVNDITLHIGQAQFIAGVAERATASG